MKRFFLLTLALSTAASSHAVASLGENEKQIEALYGKRMDNDPPDENGVTTVTYHKGSYIILVQFLKGRSVAETFTRKDQAEFSDKELSIILKANSGGKEWKPEAGKKLHWERSDQLAKAWCQTFGARPTLLISAN